MSILQEKRAEHDVNTVEMLNRRLRPQDTKSCNRNQECEASRQEHALLQAEPRSRERAHQEARSDTFQELAHDVLFSI